MTNTFRNTKQCGFTLVELMITIFISSLLTVAFYGTYILQRTSYATQGQITEMQQNIRAGIGTMMLDLRLAGYDPEGNGAGGIIDAQNSNISFTADLDEDGVVDENGSTDTPPLTSEFEHFKYDLNGTTLRRSATRDDNVNDFQPVSNNIQAIEFAYIEKNGSVVPPTNTASELAKIQSVRVSILARAKNSDSKYTDSQPYTTALGTVWGPFNDGFRRRLIITQIDLRNMGL